MPKIPDSTLIERAVPQGARRSTRDFGPSGAGGHDELGKGLRSLARNLKNVDNAERAHKIDSASLSVATELEGIKHSFDQDPDFATIGERSEQAIQEALDKASEKVDERDREVWRERQGVYVERARTHVNKVAWVKEKDHNRAELSGQISSARQAAMVADDIDLQNLVDNVNNRVESSVAKGYLSAQEGEKIMGDLRQDWAEGRLRMLPPESRLDALGTNWAKENIPADRHAELSRGAKDEQRTNWAVGFVDGVIEQHGGDQVAAQKAIDKVKDPRDRMAAEQRYHNERVSMQNAEKDRQSEVYNQFHMAVMHEGATYEQLDPTVLEELLPSQRLNLKNLSVAQQTGAERKSNDPRVYEVAAQLEANGQWRDLSRHLSMYGSGLKSTTYDAFQKAAQERKPGNSARVTSMVNAVIVGKGGDKADRRAVLKDQVTQWQDDYIEAVGRTPTDDEIRAEIARRIVEIEPNPEGFWYTSDVPVFEADENRRVESLIQMRMAEMDAEDGLAFRQASDYIARINPGADRFVLEAAFENQKRINGYAIRTDPADRKLYTDVNHWWQNLPSEQRTQEAFINMYEKTRLTRHAANR